jgi:hypothetical protein
VLLLSVEQGQAGADPMPARIARIALGLISFTTALRTRIAEINLK